VSLVLETLFLQVLHVPNFVKVTPHQTLFRTMENKQLLYLM